jgi:UDP-GlcNAc:undecaprenyl-phosphate GlcNAc-1-phosphate transferase
MGRTALGAGLAAGLLSALLTPVLIRAVATLGLIDSPRTGKIHLRPTPTGGGLALFAAFFAVVWTTVRVGGFNIDSELRPLAGLTAAGLLMTGLGLWDDWRGLSALQKLAVQVPAAALVFWSGFRIDRLTNPFGPDLVLGGLALPLTVLWILAVVNAVNLIDGLDGLAAGIAAIAALTLAAVGFARGEVLVLLLSAILAGSLLGFLPFNFPPARMFLGDTGSLLIGLLLAVIALVENRKATLALTLAVPIVAMLVPMLDTLLAIVRRVRQGLHPLRGDTHHLHHRLLTLGLPPRRAVLLMWGVSVYFGALAYLLSVLPKRLVLWAVVVVAAGVYAALAYLWRLEARGVRAASLAHPRRNQPDRRSGRG